MKSKEMAPGAVLSNRALTPQHFLLALSLPPAFARPAPGQFVMIRPAGGGTPLLARPLSLYGHRGGRNGSRIELLYRTVGAGTRQLAALKARDAVEILGPLGRGFILGPDVDEAVLICGGMGVAPLTLFAERLGRTKARPRVVCYFGARSRDDLIGLDRLSPLCAELHIATEDGSRGERGLITDLFAARMRCHDPRRAAVFACGPNPMLQALSRLLAGTSLHCQVSVEERMACGIGACLCCATAVALPGGQASYRRVCCDGPVFNLRDLLWDAPSARSGSRGCTSP
ncbi:MAG TPA: dihydroorotate dehydrogenase electron transfer subunit [Syntrophales bacterium]|nr:dihydroorotate dehydrogenase electron transfer subunit [Syntrophales bacterium]